MLTEYWKFYCCYFAWILDRASLALDSQCISAWSQTWFSPPVSLPSAGVSSSVYTCAYLDLFVIHFLKFHFFKLFTWCCVSICTLYVGMNVPAMTCRWKTTFSTQFSPSTFVWVPGMKLQVLRLLRQVSTHGAISLTVFVPVCISIVRYLLKHYMTMQNAKLIWE